MQTSLTLKQKLAVFLIGLVLALAICVPLGQHLASRSARVAAAPQAVAVNWNGFSMEAPLPNG